MNVTVRQLRAFILGAQCGSFSAAAKMMAITQPGYSLLIRQLEEELGVKLFDRTTRRVELSIAGRQLIGSAERTLAQLDDTCRRAQDLSEGKLGTLSIAIVPSVACSLLPHALKVFTGKHPLIRLVFLEEVATDFARRVSRGEAEIGLGLLLDDDDALTLEPLIEDELVAVFDENHPLGKREVITWRSLGEFEYIAVSSQSGVRVQADRASKVAGVEIKASYEANSHTTAIGLVKASLGFAIVPRIVLDSLNLDGVLVSNIVEPRTTRILGLVTRTGYSLSPAAQAFRDAARTSVSDGPWTRARPTVDISPRRER